KMAEGFLRSYGPLELLADPRFATNGARVAHPPEIDDVITRAIGELTLPDNLALIDTNDLTVVPVPTFVLINTHSPLRAQRHTDEFAGLITAAGGLPISDARAEVDRAIQTLVVAGEEAKRLVGEIVPIEGAPAQAHRMAFTIRVPRGVVCGITAFNSPFNMVC